MASMSGNATNSAAADSATSMVRLAMAWPELSSSRRWVSDGKPELTAASRTGPVSHSAASGSNVTSTLRRSRSCRAASHSARVSMPSAITILTTSRSRNACSTQASDGLAGSPGVATLATARSRPPVRRSRIAAKYCALATESARIMTRSKQCPRCSAVSRTICQITRVAETHPRAHATQKISVKAPAIPAAVRAANTGNGANAKPHVASRLVKCAVSLSSVGSL